MNEKGTPGEVSHSLFTVVHDLPGKDKKHFLSVSNITVGKLCFKGNIWETS